MPNPDEVATLIVGGRRFDDFESVYVQDRLHEAFPIFRFTAAERDDLPPIWTRLQFKPGDTCVVYLGGRKAISGIILTRQTAYDANSHIVQLQGVGESWSAYRSSPIEKTGSHDGENIEEVAEKLLAPTGVSLKKIGDINKTPFQRLQIEPGQSIWDNLERFARPRGVIMGSDKDGNAVMIGEHQYGIVAELAEGVNIKKAQVIISIENTRSAYHLSGSTARSDEGNPSDAAQQAVKIIGSLRRYSPLLTTAEQPTWNLAELVDRDKNEYKWNEGQTIEANITVYGWLRGDGLWGSGQEVMVYSPMAMLHGERLKVETATFTQDSESGTQTVLQLRNPAYLNGRGSMRPGQPDPPAQTETEQDVEVPGEGVKREPYPDRLQDVPEPGPERMPQANFWEPRER